MLIIPVAADAWLKWKRGRARACRVDMEFSFEGGWLAVGFCSVEFVPNHVCTDFSMDFFTSRLILS